MGNILNIYNIYPLYMQIQELRIILLFKDSCNVFSFIIINIIYSQGFVFTASLFSIKGEFERISLYKVQK